MTTRAARYDGRAMAPDGHGTQPAPAPRRSRGGAWFFVVVLPAMFIGGLGLVWTIRAQVTPVATATSPTTDPATIPATNTAAPLTEEQKIEALIEHIGALEGAVFIRNRTEHTPAEAADHLRRKRASAGRRVTTARQFIEHLATKSSMTGEPYRIRLRDGGDVPAGEYLTKRLTEIESAAR